MPSSPIGLCDKTSGTMSAHSYTSRQPTTRSTRSGGLSTSRQVASSVVTQVPSDPTNARAT